MTLSMRFQVLYNLFRRTFFCVFFGVFCLCSPAHAQNPPVSCDSNGNWMMFANYDGGKLRIIIDQNIPNLRLGICTYEPVQVTITGPFSACVTEVYYAGFNSAQLNNHCGFPISASSISGVNPSITSISFAPPVGIISPPNPNNILNLPNGNNTGIICLATCDANSYQGGCNTIDQVVDHFQTRFGGSLRGLTVQYCCWSDTTPYRVSGLTGNCCGPNNTSSASINYPPGPFCTSTGTLSPILQGNSSGTFYANPPGLSIDAATGVVNLNNSIPGTYEIFYAFSINCLPFIAIDTIVISPGGSVNTQNITACINYTAPWGTLYTQSGTYSDTITTISGCDSIRILNLNILSGDLQAQIGRVVPDTCTDLQYAFSLSAGQTVTAYHWNFGDPNSGSNNMSTSPNPTHTFSSTGSYDVLCISTFACGNDTSSLRLTIDDCPKDEDPCIPTIPNVFTPNSDGVNDRFQPIAICTWRTYKIEIYNRWGQRVFASVDQSESWDGSFKDSDCPNGTYTYRLTYKNPGEAERTLTGSIMILR
jgi:gliding motility-associated-like protein